MKRRIAKKNINRFISPIIKKLPQTTYGSFVINVSDTEKVYISKNHSIVNGEVVPEGCRYKPNPNMLLNIKKTAEKLTEIVETHEFVYLRVGPQLRKDAIRIRIITE